MIHIKNPCDANWQEMTPAQSGKFCGACEKVVVDFSKMNDAEIKNYFVTYKEQKTCGRFLDSQLDRPLIIPPPTRFNTFFNRLNQIPVARTILLFLTSTSVWISGCVNNKTTGELDLRDSTEKYSTPSIQDSTAASKHRDSLLIKKGDVVVGENAPQETIKWLPPQQLMGDVCVYEPADDRDTVAITIPATAPDTSITTIHVTMGAVMMTDTISQKIKRKKK